MDLSRRTPRVLRLFARYLALVAVICLAAARPAAAALHAVAAAGALLWAVRLGRDEPSPSRWRLAAPWLLWLACWLALGPLIAHLGRPMHDQAVVLLDATLFGGHGHLALPRVAPWADGFMEVAYLSYYGLVLGPLVVLAWRRPAAACHDYTRVVLATYLVCFACYVVYPVLGPRAVEAAAALGPAAGDDGAVAVWLRRLGDSAGTAFPSSHCAGAAAAALAVGRIVGRRVGLVMGAWALLVAIATVHTGNHYVIDSVAGLAVAVAVHAVAVGRPQDRAAGRLEVSS